MCLGALHVFLDSVLLIPSIVLWCQCEPRLALAVAQSSRSPVLVVLVMHVVRVFTEMGPKECKEPRTEVVTERGTMRFCGG